MSQASAPTPKSKPEEIDEYTARMDKMVASLKQRSEQERKERTKMALMWTGIGAVIIIICVFLMLNCSSTGLEALDALMKR